MKKWFLKLFGKSIDFILPNSTKVKVPDVVTRAANRAIRGIEESELLRFEKSLENKLDPLKKTKIKIKNLDLKNPLANIQHEPLAHTPIHSQQTPLVRAMGRRKNIQQTVKEIEAKIYKQSITPPKSGTSI